MSDAMKVDVKVIAVDLLGHDDYAITFLVNGRWITERTDSSRVKAAVRKAVKKYVFWALTRMYPEQIEAASNRTLDKMVSVVDASVGEIMEQIETLGA